jgi:hypothetical protein
MNPVLLVDIEVKLVGVWQKIIKLLDQRVKLCKCLLLSLFFWKRVTNIIYIYNDSVSINDMFNKMR